MSKPEFLNISWNEIEGYCQKLVEKLAKIDFQPDVIVAPLRGGAIPAVVVAYKLGVREVYMVSASRTEDDSIESQRKAVEVKVHIKPADIKDKKVLLIDEILDSGETLAKVYQEIEKLEPKELKTAVIFIGQNAQYVKFQPDLYLETTDKWIVFPWEAQ